MPPVKISLQKSFLSAGRYSVSPVHRQIRKAGTLSCWLGEIGVVPALRGRRLGDLVLRLLLFKAQTHSAREIRLRCPVATEGFFSRLGFRPVSRESGSVEMMIRGNDVSLDSCAGCAKQNCPNRK